MKSFSIYHIISLAVIGIALFTLSFTSTSTSSTSKSKRVRFQSLGFADAKHQAKYRKVPLFIYIGSNFCSTSKKMEDIFKNKEVSLYYNTQFFCNKYETESFGNFFKASTVWNVRHYPTFLFFDKDGKLTYKEEGYHNDNQMIEMAQKALAKIKEAEERKRADEMEEMGASIEQPINNDRN